MPQIDVDAGRIYFEVHGAGRPLVLAHGIGGNHAIWFEQVAELARHYRVITFDHRGFGNSIDDGELGRSAFVDDLESLLDHLELDRVALVAQSMGGGTCLGFTCQNPERVSAFVMCDSLHGFVEPADVKSLMDEARKSTNELSQLERVLGDATRLGESAKAALYSQLNSFNAANRHNLKGRFSPLYEPEALAATSVPVLFLVGEHDVLFPAAAVRAMHEKVAGSAYAQIEGAGHSVFFERPAEFNTIVKSFLDRVLAD